MKREGLGEVQEQLSDVGPTEGHLELEMSQQAGSSDLSIAYPRALVPISPDQHMTLREWIRLCLGTALAWHFAFALTAAGLIPLIQILRVEGPFSGGQILMVRVLLLGPLVCFAGFPVLASLILVSAGAARMGAKLRLPLSLILFLCTGPVMIAATLSQLSFEPYRDAFSLASGISSLAAVWTFFRLSKRSGPGRRPLTRKHGGS